MIAARRRWLITPDLDTLLRRVEKPERQNRSLRWAGALLLLASLALALFAAARGRAYALPLLQHPVAAEDFFEKIRV
jgi:hypothetical protein